AFADQPFDGFAFVVRPVGLLDCCTLPSFLPTKARGDDVGFKLAPPELRPNELCPMVPSSVWGFGFGAGLGWAWVLGMIPTQPSIIRIDAACVCIDAKA